MAAAVTLAKARAVARAAAARMVAMTGPDGRFLYRYALNDPTFTSAAYSNARHIAAVWAMAGLANDMADVSGYAEALARAAGMMEAQLFRPYGSTGALCVLDEGFIKLGGGALGVAAEAALPPSPERADRIARLARHIVSQRQGDGDFTPARIPGALPRARPNPDDLTPGQAVLGLAIAAKATGEASFRQLAVDSIDRFAARDHLVGRLAHWMLYAIEAVDGLVPDDLRLAYADRLASGIAAVPLGDDSIPPACVSEGLLAYARTLGRRGGHDAKVRAILAGVEGNLRVQLRFFHPSGAFVMSHARQEVRIDSIMHNLLAFHGWAALSAAGVA